MRNYIGNTVHISHIRFVLLSFGLIVFVTLPLQNPIAHRMGSEIARGKTVIPGTYSWDIEKNRLGRAQTNDLFWQHQTERERYLVPLNGAQLSVVTDSEFEKIDLKFLTDQKFSTDRISGSDDNPILVPGVVFALKTMEGNIAKVRVIGFRKLHDFDFDEAALLSSEWREFALKKPDIDKYHLEVEWVLFRNSN